MDESAGKPSGGGSTGREEDKRLIPSYKSNVDSNPAVILQGNPSFRWKDGAPVSETKHGRRQTFFFLSRNC